METAKRVIMTGKGEGKVEVVHCPNILVYSVSTVQWERAEYMYFHNKLMRTLHTPIYINTPHTHTFQLEDSSLLKVVVRVLGEAQKYSTHGRTKIH